MYKQFLIFSYLFFLTDEQVHFIPVHFFWYYFYMITWIGKRVQFLLTFWKSSYFFCMTSTCSRSSPISSEAATFSCITAGKQNVSFSKKRVGDTQCIWKITQRIRTFSKIFPMFKFSSIPETLKAFMHTFTKASIGIQCFSILGLQADIYLLSITTGELKCIVRNAQKALHSRNGVICKANITNLLLYENFFLIRHHLMTLKFWAMNFAHGNDEA